MFVPAFIFFIFIIFIIIIFVETPAGPPPQMRKLQNKLDITGQEKNANVSVDISAYVTRTNNPFFPTILACPSK
jgi:hypothetical protein